MTPKGPWKLSEIDAFLGDARVPVRVAVNGASGHPVLASLWFTRREGRLWCATRRDAHIHQLLEKDPRCGFEVSVEAPPYRGVRGTAVATLDPSRGELVLRELIDRYLGDATSKLARQLLARAEDEVAIGLEPRTLVSWDFTERMRGIE